MSGIDLSSWFSPSTSLLLQAAAGGYAAMGSYNQAETQAASLGYEAAVASNNARIAQYQRSTAMVIGQQPLDAYNMKAAGLMGEERATMAANGVDLGSGSAQDVLAGSKLIATRDAMTIQDNAARQAWAYQNIAAGYNAEAEADRNVQGSISPWANAAGSLLTSANSVASGWYRHNQSIYGSKG